MEILNKVLNYIDAHKLIIPGDSLICAVSGGADSVCMLDILVSLKEKFSLKIYVAHLNHGLRGDEAKRDELFVKNLCEKYSLPFYCKNVNVKELSKKLKSSCEEAGRIARYEFFYELKKELCATKIVTAHNKNDNVETVLMRILRGTDLTGLSGISAYNENNVIRPILCLSRKEIEEHLECKGKDFVTDSTNLENDFTRNKTRNKLIPYIEKDYNEGFINTFSSNIGLFGEADAFIKNYTDEKYNKYALTENYGLIFSVSDILKEDSYIAKRIIKKAVVTLSGFNISNNLCDIIYENLTKDSVITINKELNVYIKYDNIYFVKSKKYKEFIYNFKDFGTYHIPEINSFITILEVDSRPDFSSKNTVYLPKDTFKLNFILRTRKCGDKINLINCGNKKINDIFIDEKIPSFLRDEIPIMEYEGKIFWICGVRDNIPRIKSKSNKYIKISLDKENHNA